MQFLPIICSCGLNHYIDGSEPVPLRVLDGDRPNPAYKDWVRQDQLVLSWIVASVSESILPQLVGAKTAREAWTKLVAAYATGSKTVSSSLSSLSSHFLLQYSYNNQALNIQLLCVWKPLKLQEVRENNQLVLQIQLQQKKSATMGFGVYTYTQSGRQVINPRRASERVLSSGSLKNASQTNVDLGFKPPGLKWKGKNAMTGNQLQLMSQRKKL